MAGVAGFLGGLAQQYNTQQNIDLQKQHLSLQRDIYKGQEAQRTLTMQQLGLSIQRMQRDWQEQQQMREAMPQPGAAPAPNPLLTGGRPPLGAEGDIAQTDVTPQMQRNQTAGIPTPMGTGESLTAPPSATEVNARMGMLQQRANGLTAQARNPQAQAFADTLITRRAFERQYPPLVIPYAQIIKSIETGGSANPATAVNPDSGATGFGQLMPSIANRYRVTDPMDPAQNVNAMTDHIADLYAKHQGDPRAIALEYYGGPDTAQHGPKTQAYADKFIARLGNELPPAGGSFSRQPPSQPTSPQGTNPLQEGELGQLSQAMADEQLHRTRLGSLLAKSPGNMQAQAAYDTASSRIGTLMTQRDTLVRDAIGTIPPELEQMARERFGKSVPLLYQQGPTGNGWGGPQAVQALQQGLESWKTERGNRMLTQETVARGQADEAVRNMRPIAEVSNPPGAWRDVTGDPLPSSTLLGKAKALEANQQAIHIDPGDVTEANQLARAKTTMAQGAALYADAKADYTRLEQHAPAGAVNIASWWKGNSGQYPAIEKYQAWAEGPGTTVLKALGVPETAHAKSFPNLEAQLNIGALATGVAEVASGAFLARLNAYLGSHAIVGGAGQVAKAASEGRAITNLEYGNARFDMLVEALNQKMGEILHNPQYRDGRLPVFSAPTTVYPGGASPSP